MVDKGIRNCLIVDKHQRTGTVELPDGKVIVVYEGDARIEKEPPSSPAPDLYEETAAEDTSSGQRPRLSEGTGLPLPDNAGGRDLDDILCAIPGMEDRGRRNTLVAALPQDWQENLHPRPAKTRDDVIYIVTKVRQWSKQTCETGPMESLIETAIKMAQDSKSLQDELRRHLYQVRKDRHPFGDVAYQPGPNEVP